MKIIPFLKWAGGKRWLLANYSDLFPIKYNHYFEPFLGGGAVFFGLLPAQAVLGDANKELINVYKAIKKDWEQVYSRLSIHHKQHAKSYYYNIRSHVPSDPFSRAARFIYLNRTCWNGLYRVNKKGLFNVPIGTKTKVTYEEDDFAAVAKVLNDADIRTVDFECLIDETEKNDFVFVDPPYTVMHSANSFIKYNENLFSWYDQERLAEALTRAKSRGVKIIASNADHSCIRNLYQAEFEITTIARSSIIAGKSSARKKCTELIIRN